MTVRFADLSVLPDGLRRDLAAAHERVVASGQFALGPEVTAFEQEFASYTGAGHTVGVASGTDALALALVAVGVREGDEVLVAAHTAPATWVAVASLGAVPVGVDVSEETCLVDLESVRSAATRRTRAVVPVHLYGRLAPVDAITEWARQQGVKVVIDAAQAVGAIGGAGDAVAWSFYPTKTLGALGDGGAVTTDDPDIAARVRRLRAYGLGVDGSLVEIGRSSRLDELQAAFLRAKLSWVEALVEARRVQAARYAAGLAELPLVLPDADARATWHQYVVRVADRDRVQAGLLEAGVETKVHYPRPPYREPAFDGSAGRHPVADRLAVEVLSLPMGPHLTIADQERVIATLHAVLGGPQPRTAQPRPTTG